MAADNPMAAPGGSFMFEPANSRPVYCPEHFDEEQRAIAFEAQKFMDTEVVPNERYLESKEGKASGAIIKLLKKCCELGFALVDVPEKYDGLEAPKVTSLLMCEKLGGNGDFSVTFGAHSGIGMAPIILFGTHEQKKKWLSKIGDCEVTSCYALTEPGSGSDALAARTTAVLNEAGTHYILNGTKQFITNGMWMDVGVVFAKVDGDKFTAFIVERDTPGFKPGAEEHKLGLRGSSTTQLIFEDAPVPVENVLGDIGKGHRVAFNTLNLGRLKLGASVVGGAKRALRETLTYAADRKQFRTRVIDFGALREQLADSVVQLYLAESLNYRIAGAIDALLEGQDKGDPQVLMAAVEQYIVESSISKVYSSEALDRILDRCLQMHGGYGYVEEYCIEKFVRDGRVNRIFEGTNEINRLLIPGTLIKRMMQGRLDAQTPIMELEKLLAVGAIPPLPDDEGLGRAQFALQRLKWLAMTVFHAATTRHGLGLESEQEILIGLANLIIDCFAVDSAISRTTYRVGNGKDDMNGDAAACTKVAAFEALDRGVVTAWRLIEAMFEGDDLETWAGKLNQLSAHVPANLIALKRQVAASAVDAGGYNISTY